MAVGAQPQTVGSAGPFFRGHARVVARTAWSSGGYVGRLADIPIPVWVVGDWTKRRSVALTTLAARTLEEDLDDALWKVVSPRERATTFPGHLQIFSLARAPNRVKGVELA